MPSPVKFLCAIAGVRSDALARAPKGAAQAATIGALLLVTAVLAGCNGGYALYRVFIGEPFALPVAILGGTAWATLIGCIDRLLLLGMDRATDRRAAMQVLLRAPLAVVLGLTLSKPMLLNVTRPLLEGELRRQERAQVTDEATANALAAGLPERQAQVKLAATEVSTQRDRLKGEPDSADYREATDIVARTDARWRITQVRNDGRVAAARREIAQLRSRLIDLEPAETTRLETLSASIDGWQRETAQREGEATAARDALAQVRREWYRQQAAQVQELERNLDQVKLRAEQTEAEVDMRNAVDSKEVARLMAPSLVNEFRTLRRITGDPKHPDYGVAQSVEWGLDICFLLLELLPVIIKATARKTPLDAAMAAVEFEEEELIAQETNRRVASLRRRAEAARQVEEQAVERWRDARIWQLRGQTLDARGLQDVREEADAAAGPEGRLN